MQNEAQMTPQQHAYHIMSILQRAQDECRADSARVEDAKAQALFETVADVLEGTMKALDDYQGGHARFTRPAGYRAADIHSPTVSDLRVDVDASEPPPRLTNEMPRERWSRGSEETTS